MKRDNKKAPARAEQNMLKVLQAERDAAQTIHNCENDARQIIRDAQDKTQIIEARTDQRISDMEMRNAHKLNHRITTINKQGEADLKQDAHQRYDSESMLLILEKLAIELCTGKVTSEQQATAEGQTDEQVV
jgi:vacuolar-type H+-ATPase subunit H